MYFRLFFGWISPKVIPALLALFLQLNEELGVGENQVSIIQNWFVENELVEKW